MRAGRGKSAAEETGGRSAPREGDAAGRAGKKELMLARLREWGTGAAGALRGQRTLILWRPG